jgi:hypothetical protein
MEVLTAREFRFAIENASSIDDVERIKVLYNKDKDHPYLHVATYLGAKRITEWLLCHTDINPNASFNDPKGTYQHDWRPACPPATLCQSNAMFQLFLKNARNLYLHAKAGNEMTLLERAIWKHYDVGLLLQNGADILEPEHLRGGRSRTAGSGFRKRVLANSFKRHRQRGMMTHYQKLVAVTRASRKQKITLSVDLIRQLRPFMY